MRKQVQEAEREQLLSGTSARHDAPAAPIAKGHAAFWVGAEQEELPHRRFAVPVGLLAHPRIVVRGAARGSEEYGYTHEGAVVFLCSAERLQEAVDAAREAEEQHRHGVTTITIHFRMTHLAAGCFRPSHAVS